MIGRCAGPVVANIIRVAFGREVFRRYRSSAAEFKRLDATEFYRRSTIDWLVATKERLFRTWMPARWSLDPVARTVRRGPVGSTVDSHEDTNYIRWSWRMAVFLRGK